MYPARATLQHVIKAWWKVVWQKAGKTLPVFFFVNEHNNTNTKPQAKKQRLFKVIPEEKQKLVKKKDADNIRKVLCKSLPSRLFWFPPVILLLLLKWKSRNITKYLVSGPSGNQLVLFSLESWCFPRRSRRKHQKLTSRTSVIIVHLHIAIVSFDHHVTKTPW